MTTLKEQKDVFIKEFVSLTNKGHKLNAVKLAYDTRNDKARNLNRNLREVKEFIDLNHDAEKVWKFIKGNKKI